MKKYTALSTSVIVAWAIGGSFSALAGQAPFAAPIPDIKASSSDRGFVAEQFSKSEIKE